MRSRLTAPMLRRRTTVLAALAAFSVAIVASEGTTLARPASTIHVRDGACGTSGGVIDVGYPDPDSADTDGHCTGDFGDYAAQAYTAISSIATTPDSCATIRDFLNFSATLFEWTGWNETSYFWDAGTWGTDVGFHWAWMSDEGLWTHEGAHAAFGSDENEAEYFRGLCANV